MADTFLELCTYTANMHKTHFSSFHYVCIIITLIKHVIFDFFAFPVNCCSRLIELYCSHGCRKFNYFISIDFIFVCASCVWFAESQQEGCSKCEIPVLTEGAMWGAGTTQAEWGRPQDETHYQSYLHHLGQQPPLQQQWEDQWSLSHGACLLFYLLFHSKQQYNIQNWQMAQTWKKGLYQRLLVVWWHFTGY